MREVELIELASNVLVLHQRNGAGCLCGEAKPGTSHPKHMIEMLRLNGIYLHHGKQADS